MTVPADLFGVLDTGFRPWVPSGILRSCRLPREVPSPGRSDTGNGQASDERETHEASRGESIAPGGRCHNSNERRSDREASLRLDAPSVTARRLSQVPSFLLAASSM